MRCLKYAKMVRISSAGRLPKNVSFSGYFTFFMNTCTDHTGQTIWAPSGSIKDAIYGVRKCLLRMTSLSVYVKRSRIAKKLQFFGPYRISSIMKKCRIIFEWQVLDEKFQRNTCRNSVKASDDAVISGLERPQAAETITPPLWRIETCL